MPGAPRRTASSPPNWPSRGFTGGDDGLDGQWGFFQVFGGGADLDRLIAVLGRPYTIVNPGVSFKPYPCGILSHPRMDAMLKVVTDHDLKPEQIKAVRAPSRLEHPRSAALQDREDRARSEVLRAVPAGEHRCSGARPASASSPTSSSSSEPVQQMMARVTTVFDPEDRSAGLRQDSQRCRGRSRSTAARLCSRPTSDIAAVPTGRSRARSCTSKFTDCAVPVLAPDRIRQALEQIESSEKLKDIRELTRTLSASA